MIMDVVRVIITVLCMLSLSSANDNGSTLKLVFGVFRHGNRTADAKGIYPNDPYKNETYYPYGLGHLTNEGKRVVYQLGKKLRERYNDFLGTIFTPHSLRTGSTEKERTKASLQLVLAGLYPPKGTILEWDPEINWQPIAYDHLSDHIMTMPLLTCPKFIKLYEEYTKSPEGQVIERRYSHQFAFISNSTGLEVNRVADLFFLHFALATEKEWGFTLPAWTDQLYPEYFESLVKDFYASSMNDTERKQLVGGDFLKEIIGEMRAKMANEQNDSKLFLYSAHEFSLSYALGVLEVYYPHIPQHAACLLVELHKLNERYGVKIFYLESPNEQPLQLVVPGCEKFCDFQMFEDLLKKNIATEKNACLI